MSATCPPPGCPARRSLVAAACLAFSLFAPSAARPAPAQAKPAAPPIADKCRTDLAARLSVPSAEVSVVSQKAVIWPDAALGIHRPGEVVAQVRTPGFSMYLRARGTDYLYTASARAFRYGGPAGIWSISLLCVQPKPGDPNFNGTLVQLSPVGTNPTPILDDVTSFSPQHDGSVFATRRTSRSGFDLLYLAPGGRDRAQVVASGLDFGPAALAKDGKTWAAFVRPGLGQPLSLTIRSLGDPPSKGQTFELPGGIVGAALRWDGDTVVATVRAGNDTKLYLLIQVDGVRSWKKLDYSPREDGYSMLLNKSESLVVSGTTVDGKPAARIYTRWFTGDEHEVAVIKGFQLQHVDMTEYSRFVGISGHRDGKPAVAVVDFRTHETIIVDSLGGAAPRVWRVPTRSAPELPAKPSE